MIGIAACCLAGAAPASAHEGLAAKIATYTARLAQSPADATLLLERAECFRLQREWRPALADLAAAEALAPDLVAAIDLARARLFVDARDGERAVAAADRVLARRADDSLAHLLRAQALVQLGRGEAAVTDFDRAVATSREPDPNLYYARAEQLFALGGDWRQRAIDGLDDGIARTAGAAQLEELALRYEVALASWDAALDRVARIARSSPRPEIWGARASELLESAGRGAQALVAATSTLETLGRLPSQVRALVTTRRLQEELTARCQRLRAPSTKSP